MNDNTGLPNDCTLIAAAACKWLADRNIKHCILRIVTAGEGHQIVVFESGGFLAGYDSGGGTVFRKLTWKSKPILFAKIWNASGKRVKPSKAYWYK